MTKGIRVRTGTIGKETPQERRAAWVETTLTLYPEAHDLANALGSKYLRHVIAEDDDLESDRPKDLPDSLTQREILRIYRDEIFRSGEEITGMWSDSMSETRFLACRKWLMEVVLDAFPEMKGYEIA